MATKQQRDVKSYNSFQEETNTIGLRNRKRELEGNDWVSRFNAGLDFVKVKKLGWIRHVLSQHVEDLRSPPAPMLCVTIRKREVAALRMPVGREVPPLIGIK